VSVEVDDLGREHGAMVSVRVQEPLLVDTNAGDIGTFENDWVVVPATIDDGGTVSIAPAFPVGEFTDFETVLDFAGYREDGEVVVHSAGDAVATVFDTDGTESGEVDLDGPSRSVWIKPGRSVLRVDSQGTLTIGDIPVPGDYQWART